MNKTVLFTTSMCFRLNVSRIFLFVFEAGMLKWLTKKGIATAQMKDVAILNVRAL